MRLVTYSSAGSGSRLGVEAAGGTIHDLTAVLGVADVGEMLARGIAAGDIEDLRAGARTLEPDEVALQAPIRRPGKIICVGLNYHDHCREQGVEPPTHPILFSKFANAVTHPGAPVTRPAATERCSPIEPGRTRWRRRDLRDPPVASVAQDSGLASPLRG